MGWFTGTSTGRQYSVGGVYANGNGSFQAQADGTFKDVNSGKVLVGSSQDPRVTFGGGSQSGPVSSSLASGGPGSPGVRPQGAKTGGPGSGGASLGGATVHASSQSGVGAGVRVSVKFAKGATLATVGGSPGGSKSAYGVIEEMPQKRIGTGGYQEPGTQPDIGWFKTQSGWALRYSEAAKEFTEDDLLAQSAWYSRNILGPAIVRDPLRPPWLPAEGYQWQFLTQEWVPDRKYIAREEVKSDMEDFRSNGVLAPLSPNSNWGAPAPWLQ